MADTVPLVVSTYKRLEHLQRCIASLQRNMESRSSVLIVCSDAPRPGDEAAVAAVRKYVSAISGFEAVVPRFSSANDRVANNRGGMRYALDTYGAFVFLEEDCVVSKHFLRMMNLAVRRYEDDGQVFAVCGYAPPVPRSDDGGRLAPVRVSRFSAWGFATWADRFQALQLDWTGEYWRQIWKHRRLLHRRGSDLMPLARQQYLGRLNALDVIVDTHAALNDQRFVSFTKSLVTNTGNDGSGEHFGTTDRFDVALYGQDGPSELGKEIVDERLWESYRKFYSGSLLKRFASLLKLLGGYKWLQLARRAYIRGLGAGKRKPSRQEDEGTLP